MLIIYIYIQICFHSIYNICSINMLYILFYFLIYLNININTCLYLNNLDKEIEHC